MKKYLKIAGIIVLVLFAIIYAVKYNLFSVLALNFSKDNPNGEFFKVILTVVGGIGFIWGLWINSKRIKEQNRQNSISENSNSDKRFSDAIGYLSDERTTTILGGIYALYQLAKEDARYRSIVANLLTSYIKEKSVLLYSREAIIAGFREKREVPIIIQTIIDVLFHNTIFDDIQIDLSHTNLNNIDFNVAIKNCNFSHSHLVYCSFHCELNNCEFEYSNIKYCNFGFIPSKITILNCKFYNSLITNTYFSSIRIISNTFQNAIITESTFYVLELLDCDFYLSNNSTTINFSCTKSFEGSYTNKIVVISYEMCEDTLTSH